MNKMVIKKSVEACGSTLNIPTQDEVSTVSALIREDDASRLLDCLDILALQVLASVATDSESGDRERVRTES